MRHFVYAILILLISLPVTAKPALAFDQANYVATTPDNLLGAYWRLGRMKANNAQHVDQSLKVLECNIYKRFEVDEFELAKIRTAFMQKLQLLSRAAPLHFQYTQPLLLDNYDFERQAFVLSAQTRWNNVFRQRISGNSSYYNTCANSATLLDVPLNAIMRQAQPFSMVDVPMSQALAQKFIQYTNALNMDMSRGRPAYAVFYVTLASFIQDAGTGSINTERMAELSGQIDRVEVYADAQRQRLLYAFEPTKMTTGQSAVPDQLPRP